MLVEKCKRVVMEERRGRHRARRMAREVGSIAMNPVSAVGGFAESALSTVTGGASEDMSGGAKVLLLLAGAAAVGGGIYYYATKPKTTAVPATTPPVVNPNTGATLQNPDAMVPGTALTYRQAVALAAGLNNTSVAAWQASGIPSAKYALLSTAAQQGISMLGIRVV
jgi:hypothetical protein